MPAWFIAWTAARAGMEVQVDPRVELLQAVSRAAGAREFQDAQSDYTRSLDALMAEHLDHRAVRSAQEPRVMLGGNAPVGLAILLDDDLSGDLRSVAPPYRRWLRSVRSLSEESA